VSKHARFAALYWRYRRTLKRVERDSTPYQDKATAPVQSSDLDALEMFTATPAAKWEAEKQRRRAAAPARVEA